MIYMRVSISGGKMDDLGVPLFQETPIWVYDITLNHQGYVHETGVNSQLLASSSVRWCCWKLTLKQCEQGGHMGN